MEDDHAGEMQKESEYASTNGVVNHTDHLCADNAASDGLLNEERGTQKELSPSIAQEASRDYTEYQQMPNAKHLLRRPLGGLETVYHHAMSKGQDMICLMTKLSTTFPVISDLAKKALHCLADQHPLLRMTIQCAPAKTSKQISFLEMEEARIDYALQRGDWLSVLLEEVAEPFDVAKGPLWKCRLLLSQDKVADSSTPVTEKDIKPGPTVNERINGTRNEPTDFVHESTLLFLWHHSIMDGGYVVSIFKEFAEILDKLHSGVTVDSRCLSASLPPPLEHVLQVSSQFTFSQHNARRNINQETCSQSLSSVRPDSSHSWTETLEDYNRKFLHEIAHFRSTSPRNECMVYEFNEVETKHIRRICKLEGVTANGLFSAASILAFVDLLYPVSQRTRFGIPFEFMLDFRKHLPLTTSRGSRKYFQGVASIHIPMMANVKFVTRPVTKQEFWAMSRSFGSAIQNEVDSAQTFQWIKDLVSETTGQKHPQPAGKSPYVLCLSNMGRMDGVLTGDISKRMKLTGLHGHPTVLIENSPIFFVSIFLLNDKLCGNVSFCENYTSQKTAAEYIGHFKKQILSHAKL